MKWRNHSSVLDIIAVHENRERFTFSSAIVADVAKEMNIVNSSKALQEAYFPVKLLKDKKEFFFSIYSKIF